MSVSDHYDQHLGPIYSWMAGGVESAMSRGAAELDAIDADPRDGGWAVDLGAGFGMHAIPLARRGFNVLALDTCGALLDELRAHSGVLPVHTIEDDLRSFPRYLAHVPELVLCMGDTLTHLKDRSAVTQVIAEVSHCLPVGGRFVVTLRDYSCPLVGEQRFIPVRSDENRILTCFLEYADSKVSVYDICYQREGSRWEMKVSQYDKLRLSPDWLAACMESNGLTVNRTTTESGMLRFTAQKS